jgi:excisionase family DNA binding protein
MPVSKREVLMPESEADTVLTIKEVSDYLRLAESTIYKLAKEGELPGRKVGGAWRFSKRGLDDWLRERPLANTNT